MSVFKNLWDPSHEWRSKCDASVQTMMDLVRRGNLLNHRQCEDLTRKLSTINENIHLILQHCTYWGRLSLRDYSRCLEKAKMLVTNCGEKEWWRVAAFQWQNVNAFQEILLDASLCYNVIYEHLKDNFKESAVPDDLRKSSVFHRASDNVVREDDEHLIACLEQLIKDPGAIEGEHPSCPEEVARAQALARFLTIRFASDQFVVEDKKGTSIGIMWDDQMEPPGTWGEVCDLKGTGSEAVKAISTEWLGVPCFRKEFLADEDENVFLKEASIMAHMKHPNIIRFLCHGNSQNPKCRFIGMELMEMSLAKLIEEQGGKLFQMDVALDIIKQIARGMCYLHDQDVAHRDLKPQNVVIKKWGSLDFERYCDVKLVDFGISKTKVDDSKSNTITYYGIGTSKYRAPELHPSARSYSRNRATWFKADVYSFAMTCVHILSLQPPFEDMERQFSRDELYSKIMDGAKPNIPRCIGFASLKKLLQECWHILPSKRPTFVEICSNLEIIQVDQERRMFSKVANKFIVEFTSNKIVAQSDQYKSLPKVILCEANERDSKANLVVVDKQVGNDAVAIISCTLNHNLTHHRNSPYETKSAIVCDMCGEGRIDGEAYHCSTCQFDAHLHCAEIREKVHVFYHGHPLQLLVRNFYKDNPKAMCSLCEESIQNSEWVYHCERCEYDVHSLCTKYPNNIRSEECHKHPLIMRSCPPQKILFCERCNGEIGEHAWHYYCKPCAFSMHLTCVFRPINPLCSFDNSHRFVFEIVPRIYNCGLCYTQGYSHLYHCTHCNIDMHPDCVDYINEETCKWNEAYEKVMMEKESKDVQAQIILISQILDKTPSYGDSQAKSLNTHKPPSVVKKVKTPSYNPTTFNESHESLDSYNDVKHQRKMISAQTAERIKAKKLALNRLRENPLEILENLEKIVSNLQSIANASEDEKIELMAMYERLKKRQQLVNDEQATQDESKLSPGPRIGVFFKNVKKDGKFWGRQLLIDLQAGMKDVCFGLLCEKAGHEHIIPNKSKVFDRELNEEYVQNLKPLQACGLEIVRNNITSIEDDLAGLESISIPNLDANCLWDLSAIGRIKGMEDIGVLKQAAVSSSQWFLKVMELERNVKENYDLHRIRFIVTHEGNPPCYQNGSVAWLCTKHFDEGLNERILESCSSKYHNVEDDYEIRYPPYIREG